MLPELLAWPPQLSEIMATRSLLKVFSEPPAEEVEAADPATPLLSQVPFTETSWPTWAETSCPVRETALPFLVSSTYCPPCDWTHPFSFFSLFSILFWLGLFWSVWPCAELSG